MTAPFIRDWLGMHILVYHLCSGPTYLSLLVTDQTALAARRAQSEKDTVLRPTFVARVAVNQFIAKVLSGSLKQTFLARLCACCRPCC